MHQPNRSSGPDPKTMRSRIVQLERLARSLPPLDFSRFERAAGLADGAEPVWSPSDRFWFSGGGGVSVPRSLDRDIRLLWTRVLIGLAASQAGKELDPRWQSDESVWDGSSDPSYGLTDGLEVQSVEGQATTLLERSVGGNVWLGTTVLWNAFCAALLMDTIPEHLLASLEAPWQMVLGPTPRRLISAPREP